MKKIFSLIIFCVFTLCICLTGCDGGCFGFSALKFNNNFNGGNEPTSDFYEKLTYSVTYDDKKYFTASSNVSSDLFSYGTGSYESVLELLTVKPNIESDILDRITSADKIYLLTTSFSIPVHYNIENGINALVIDRTDTISTKCYFLGNGMSFAPVYSETVSDYSVLNRTNDGFEVKTINTQTSISYSQKSYVVNRKVDGVDIEPSDYDYSIKTLIDNNQLLFAIRNVQPTEEQNALFPTVSPSYGEYKSLSVKYVNQTSDSFDFKVEDNQFTNTIALTEYSFNIESSSASGSLQKVFVQKSASDNLEYKSFVMKYVEPLTTFGSFEIIGSLVYTLTGVSFTK